ncbi:MAG: EAL domain-containing protein, partial [Geminicoccaceae bacterium]|nr:EAL domain-containing protein [Geminicoccaceae bacterium]
RAAAEAAGSHERLTWWMVEAAVRQLAAWAEAGMPRLHLALPLAARQGLAWRTLADHAAAALDRAGVDRHRIEFEIDEARLQEEMDGGGKGLAELREAGLRIALVGFGEGPASLKLLRDAPLDTVRLSPSLVEGVPHERHRTVFLETVVHLVRMSQMRLVVEGVEGPQQLKHLKRAGCHAVQGAVGEAPLDAGECAHWLRQAIRRRA